MKFAPNNFVIGIYVPIWNIFISSKACVKHKGTTKILGIDYNNING